MDEQVCNKLILEFCRVVCGFIGLCVVVFGFNCIKRIFVFDLVFVHYRKRRGKTNPNHQR